MEWDCGEDGVVGVGFRFGEVTWVYVELNLSNRISVITAPHDGHLFRVPIQLFLQFEQYVILRL